MTGRSLQTKEGSAVNQNVIYVSVDVDDERYHGCALDESTGEMLDFRCRSTKRDHA